MDVYKRQYNCRGCGMKHGKPTGRGCKNVRNGEGNSAVQGKRAVTNIMVEQAANTQTLQEVENTDNLHMTTARVGAQEIQADGTIQNNDCSEYVRKSDLDSFMEEMKSMFSQTQERLLKIESKEKEVDLPAAECNIEDAMHSQESGNKLHGKDSATDSADVQAEVVFKAGEVERTVKTVENSQRTCASGDKQNSRLDESQMMSLFAEMRSFVEEARAGIHQNTGGSSALASTEEQCFGGSSALASTEEQSIQENASGSEDTQVQTGSSSKRVDTQVKPGGSIQRGSDFSGQFNNNAVSMDQTRGITDGNGVNVNSLRMNADIINRASARLAELGVTESMVNESVGNVHVADNKGRKSGAVSKATDRIVKSTDWPHYHIVGGIDMTPSSYEELSLGEFVLGFIRMLQDVDSVYDKDLMLEVLRDILEDSVDFSWQNAKAFFRSTALQVEQGKLKWSDYEVIQKRRFIQCRVNKSTNNAMVVPKKSTKQLSQGSSCCAAFQTGVCDKRFDHAPFVHACSYCWANKGILVKHREIDCHTLANKEASKNV